MMVSEQEVQRVRTKRVAPTSRCVIAATSDAFSEVYGFFAKISSSSEDRYVVGDSRKEALEKAVVYATEVLKIPHASIGFALSTGQRG
jgi:hypothetical protein